MSTRSLVIVIFLVIFIITGVGTTGAWFALYLESQTYDAKLESLDLRTRGKPEADPPIEGLVQEQSGWEDANKDLQVLESEAKERRDDAQADLNSKKNLRADALREWETSRKPIPRELGGSAGIVGKLELLDKDNPDSLEEMEKDEDGWWRLPEDQDSLALLFSLKAAK